MDIQRSIQINAMPEDVWPFLTDPEKILEWYVPLTKFEYTSEQRSGLNAPFYFEEEVPGGPMQLDCAITEWVENETLAFKMVSGNMMRNYEEKWTVEAISSGSRFTFRMQGEYASAFLRLIGPIAQRTSINTIEKILPRLKSLVEG
jgi:uncharacterized protein YndB with AHSA1/START domain